MLLLAFLLTAGLAKNGFKTPGTETASIVFQENSHEDPHPEGFAPPEESSLLSHIVSSNTKPEIVTGPSRGPATVALPSFASDRKLVSYDSRLISEAKRLSYLNSGFQLIERAKFPEIPEAEKTGDGLDTFFTRLDFSLQLNYEFMINVWENGAEVWVLLGNQYYELKNHNHVQDSDGRQFLYVTTSNCHASMSEFITAILVELPRSLSNPARFWIQKKFSREWTEPRDVDVFPDWNKGLGQPLSVIEVCF